MQPDQKAQARTAYSIDIFTTIPAETTVTFTTNGDRVTVTAPGITSAEMSAATFEQYFKYYKQADLFTAPAAAQEKATKTTTTQAGARAAAGNPQYKYNRETSIVILNDPHHPHLQAYSRMINRLEKARAAGICEFSGAGCWARYTFNTPKGRKSVQVNDRVTFPGDDIKYSIHISFYQFN